MNPYGAARGDFGRRLTSALALAALLTEELKNLDGQVGYKLGDLIEEARSGIERCKGVIEAASKEWTSPDPAAYNDYASDTEADRGCYAYHDRNGR